MPTMEDLKYFQAMPLDIKVSLTKTRIREWVGHYGMDGVYISFSGGKDSTVLLHLVRELYPDIPAVFVDTGLEYPEIRDFVKTFDNVVWLKPEKSFKQVIEDYGYPFISKTVSHNVRIAKRNPNGKVKKNVFSPEKKGQYAMYKWSYFLDSPFDIDDRCCDVMKKKPASVYVKKTGRFPFLATMADESIMRRDKWIKNGCNAFNDKRPKSTPMSFWTEQDVLRYIKIHNIKIASVYGDVVADEHINGDTIIKGQNTIYDYLPESLTDSVKLRTTGCKRTGCMFCGFGCHLEKKGEGRFENMKITHPKQYDYIMRPTELGGLNYKEVIDWINEKGQLNIRY